MQRADLLDKLIQHLDTLSECSHKAMYIGSLEVPVAVAYLEGLSTAAEIAGMRTHLREAVELERGWKRKGARAAWRHMQERGLSDAAIIDELFIIELETWRRSNPPVM